MQKRPGSIKHLISFKTKLEWNQDLFLWSNDVTYHGKQPLQVGQRTLKRKLLYCVAQAARLVTIKKLADASVVSLQQDPIEKRRTIWDHWDWSIIVVTMWNDRTNKQLQHMLNDNSFDVDWQIIIGHQPSQTHILLAGSTKASDGLAVQFVFIWNNGNNTGVSWSLWSGWSSGFDSSWMPWCNHWDPQGVIHPNYTHTLQARPLPKKKVYSIQDSEYHRTSWFGFLSS